MNHWKVSQIPYSWAPKDTTIKWSGMDHQDNLNKNPQRAEWVNVDISYQYNPQGFRCADLNNFLGKQVNIALGCSFTEGVGLPIEYAWPSLGEQHTEYPVLNLGLGGAATDSIARVLTNVSGLFDIQTVYILWPPIYRLEHYMLLDQTRKVITSKVYKNGKAVEPVNAIRKIETLYPMDSNPEHVWAMAIDMNEQRLYRNQIIVELLAKTYGFTVIQTTIDHVSSTLRAKELTQLDFARDGVHWGAETQIGIAKIMLDSQRIIC